MRKQNVLSAILVLAAAGAALAPGTVTVSLESSQNGQTVAGGAVIDWVITVSVSSGDNAGLAAFACDLVQDAGNPAFLNIPAGDPNSIDATMMNFSRPAGISNPGETYPTSGYTGVLRGNPGHRNLIQIGGAQNTFGQAGTTMGTNPNASGGVGQGSPQVVVSGSFAAPAASGVYTFRVDNAMANVLDALNAAPAFSPVSTATVDASSAVITFSVGPSACHGDTNCDDRVDFADITPFVDAIVTAIYCDGTGANADVNGNGSIGFDDITPFVDLLTKNPLPISCP